MENFDLTKLSTDREHLSKVLRSFIEMQTRVAHMVSYGDSLKIFGHNDKRRFTGSVTTNYLTAAFEYLGEEGSAYFKPEELIKILANKTRAKFEVPGYAQPLGWEEDLMDRSFRGESVTLDPQLLKDAISYLLRLDLSKSESEYFGIIFHNNEMISTNGQIMLMQAGMPVVTTTPRLLGFDCVMSLYSILRTPHVTEVQMGVAKKSSIFGIRVELDDGSEMFFWSKPRIGPIDDYKDPRPKVLPTSVGIVISNPALDSILESTIKGVIDNEKPAVCFQTTSAGLVCTSFGADERGMDSPRVMYQGTIPMTRSMGNADISICARADYLLQATKGMGQGVQFVIPQHPILGLQIHSIDPFYVNCNPTQFALIAPFIMERSKIISLEKLKRKANNAMEL